MDNIKYKVYGLTIKGSTEIRYIGYTRNDKRRLFEHIREAKLGSTHHKSNWIRKNDYNIDMIILEDNLSYRDALKKEVEYISRYKNLTNMTSGGEENPMNNETIRTRHTLIVKERKEAGLYKRDRFKKLIDRDELYRVYIIEGNTREETAKILNTTRRLVIRNIERYRIKKNFNELITSVDLYRLYITESRSITEISNLYNTSYPSVTRYLHRYGIRKYKKKDG